MADITSDVYGIADHVNELKKEYFSSNEESLMIGTLGYIGELFTNQWQNQIIMASQYSNEAIATKAKFKRNIIAHALALDSIDITATPATMAVQIFITEEDILNNLNSNNQFTIDSTVPIYIGNMEFHLDYDVIITRSKLQDGYVYTARYKDLGTNPISVIDDPYLKPPVILTVDGSRVVTLVCTLRQVELDTITKKIISSNTLENKTFTFEFSNQMAAFNIVAVDGDTTKKLTPVYVGLYDGSLTNYFYYEYLDDNTIRIKFSNDSYMPKLNSELTINIYTTMGAAGIFKYNDELKFTLNSSNYGYSNVHMLIRPALESTYGGYDRKTVKELKTVIPKEALSRGNIVTSTDLNNYFDLINTNDSKLYFKKRRHNQLDLLFYSHFLFRDSKSNILPTNTIKIALTRSDFDTNENGKLVLNPGTIIKYEPGVRVGHVIPKDQYDPDDEDNFYYASPFTLVVNQSPQLYASYYMTIVNSSKLLEFTWINQMSEVQFIAAEVNWIREYSEDNETRLNYVLSVEMVQNILADKGVIVKDEETEDITEVNVKVFAVFYNDKGIAYRYKELELVSYDDAEFYYTFKAKFVTNDIMTKDDKLVVWDMSDISNDNADTNYGDFSANTKVMLYVATKYKDASYGTNDMLSIIPGLEDWTLTNKYTVSDGIDFFYNYSDMISSTVTVSQNADGDTLFTLDQVPMIRYSYMSDTDNLYTFLEQLELRRQYVDSCLDKLEGAMGIDFKFYNTYGPAETYYIADDTLIDKVNMSLKFRTKILSGADKYIKDYIIQDVKEYIENIETIGDIHMPNITTLIEQKYSGQIQYFQFVSINNYDTSVQHITQLDVLEADKEEHVPELLNVDVNDDGSPRIEIIVDT
jgi:hypothetical protein